MNSCTLKALRGVSSDVARVRVLPVEHTPTAPNMNLTGVWESMDVTLHAVVGLLRPGDACAYSGRALRFDMRPEMPLQVMGKHSLVAECTTRPPFLWSDA